MHEKLFFGFNCVLLNDSFTLGSSLVLALTPDVTFALWSSRMLMNFPRIGKSLRITSSNGTLLASHPVARPPEPFLYLFSPPPPRKRRWSLFQSLSATVLLITFWIKVFGMLNWILDVPSVWEKRYNVLLASGLPGLLVLQLLSWLSQLHWWQNMIDQSSEQRTHKPINKSIN